MVVCNSSVSPKDISLKGSLIQGKDISVGNIFGSESFYNI